MDVSDIFYMVTLLLASLVVAGLASPMVSPGDKDPGSFELTEAVSNRFRDSIRLMIVTPALHLKNMTSEEIEDRLQNKARSSFTQPPGCSRKRFIETGKQSFSCMKNELSGPVEEIDDILKKEPFLRKHAASAVKTYCKASIKAIECFDPFFNATKSCLGEEMGERWSSHMLDLIQPINDFLCFNEGKRIVNLIEDDVLQCMKGKLEPAMVCVQQVEREITSNKGIGCGIPLKMQKCAVDILGKCEKKSTAGITKSFSDVVLKDIPCKDFESLFATPTHRLNI